MAEPQTPFWLAWIVPLLAVLGAVWAVVRKIFISAVQSEMASMHAENQQRFRELESQISELQSMLARIEGRMEERWGEKG